MEHNITCPNCGAQIPVSGDVYESIAAQIQQQVVDEAIAAKEHEMLEKQQTAIQMAVSQRDIQYRDALAEKDKQIYGLSEQVTAVKKQANEFALTQKNRFQEEAAQKDSQIASLKKELSMNEQDKASAVSQAVANEKDKARQKDEKIAQLHQTIAVMKNQLTAMKEQLPLRVSQSNAEHEKVEAELRERISASERERAVSEAALKSKYEAIIQAQREAIERYRDYRTQHFGTKMVGENFEKQFCDEYRSIASLLPQTASLVKDNSVVGGSKGDFIFREYSRYTNSATGVVEDTEILSIMFELKNEAIESKEENRHKNSDFFKRLDENRCKKSCQVACLVSTLESDSEYYNQGMVVVSDYEDMYVIRPDFFLPFLMVLRSAAMTTVKCRQELEELKSKNIDISNFENRLEDFQKTFFRSLELSFKKRDSAVVMIDKAIETLQKAKAELESFSKHMTEAGSKADALTIRKLTRNAPAVKQLFDEAADKKQSAISENQDKPDDSTDRDSASKMEDKDESVA